MRPAPGEVTHATRLKFHRLMKKPMLARNGAAESHYFVANNFTKPIVVNGVSIASRMVAGPLPDFSIVDIGGFLVLWWGSQAAIEYAPGQREDVGANFSIEILLDSDFDTD